MIKIWGGVGTQSNLFNISYDAHDWVLGLGLYWDRGMFTVGFLCFELTYWKKCIRTIARGWKQ